MDWGPFLERPGKCFIANFSGDKLKNFEVVTAQGWETHLHRTLRRQEQVVVLWDAKRLPCHGEDPELTSEDQEWSWSWGCPRCWLAPCGALSSWGRSSTPYFIHVTL